MCNVGGGQPISVLSLGSKGTRDPHPAASRSHSAAASLSLLLFSRVTPSLSCCRYLLDDCHLGPAAVSVAPSLPVFPAIGIRQWPSPAGDLPDELSQPRVLAAARFDLAGGQEAPGDSPGGGGGGGGGGVAIGGGEERGWVRTDVDRLLMVENEVHGGQGAAWVSLESVGGWVGGKWRGG